METQNPKGGRGNPWRERDCRVVEEARIEHLGHMRNLDRETEEAIMQLIGLGMPARFRPTKMIPLRRLNA